ncbi:hypothetical protein DSL72_001436 [Monilinia vaccinii-corymbosi]|uniref:Uncharacterized protein n=1 Tax=Monilinia vaccinii-corymbosi TaxID=61207 RepID=A0A8A3PAL5_9HELO|nr:hypothetical protein DSL72_001436 [Monilinia vaccinii-corymbosi]
MAAESNGKVVGESKPNGIKGNSHTVVPTLPSGKNEGRTKRSSGFFGAGVITRILIWYSIITILLRCPATLDLVTDTSPRICKPYFQLRSIVVPHLEPYYDSYAAPYVNAAKPYYRTLDRTVIAPLAVLGLKYGAPRVAQAQAYGQAQWENTLQPQVLKYQALVKAKYDQSLAPHWNKFVAATSPYLDQAKTNALQTYNGHIIPTFNTIQPYAIQSYACANDFVIGTGIPYTKWAITSTGVFLDRKVWPKLRILYGENVEPQLVRIGERLGRYRDGKKLQAVVDSVDSSSSASSASSIFSSISSSMSSAHATRAPPTSTSCSTSTSSTETPESTPLSEDEIRENARKVVTRDLKTWQEKFSKAADEGSDEIDDRVTEITERLIQNQANKVGSALIVELEEAVNSNLKSLKSSIISIVKSEKNAKELEFSLNTAVRKAGLAIKEKAQAVRTWRQSFDVETNSLVGKSVKDTFDIIDHIRDLGLQEIGMRWAWTDGITHKDWTKYHALKSKFDEWRLDVEKVVTEHPGLAKARAVSEDVENRAMGIAENAAIELLRIKEAGKWKISTGDFSDDFSTKYVPPAAAVAGQKVIEKINEASEAMLGTTQGSFESVSSVVGEKVGILSAKISSSALGEQPGVVNQASSCVQSAASIISNAACHLSDAASSSIASLGSTIADEASTVSKCLESASVASSTASKEVWGGAMAAHVEARQIIFDDIIDEFYEGTYSEKIQSMASVAGDQFSDMTRAVSEALLKPTSTHGSVGSVNKLAAEQYSRALAAASSVLYGTEQGTGERIASAATSRYADAVAAASCAIYGTPAPIFDSAASSAKAAYSDALSRASEYYSQAQSVVLAQVSGTPKPVHQEMLNSVESAYSDAVNAANSRLQLALSGASTAIYGVPTGAFESIRSVAASRLSDGLKAASAQYDAAKSHIGPALNPAAQQLLHQAQNQYYAGIGLAHVRYSEFLEAASSAVMPTQTSFHQSVYDKASASIVGTSTPGYEAALSQASEQYSSAVAKAQAGFDIVIDQVVMAANNAELTAKFTDLASSRYSEASSKASASYASLSSEIVGNINGVTPSVPSSVHGSEKSLPESIASVASENWEALITKASHQVYGSPTPYFVTGNFLSNVQEYAAQATDEAVSQYLAVQSLIGELVSGKEPEFIESVYSRLSSAYYTGASDAVPSASSYASEFYASASSVANSIVTPPPAIEEILDAFSLHLNEAVEAASDQFYGTEKGAYERATEAASSAYASASSAASEGIYGTQPGYTDQAQSAISNAAASAQKAISEAIYGAPTGTYESATNIIAENYQSATSAAAESYSAAQAKVSEAIYGHEQGAFESAQSRLNAAVESARAKLTEFASNVGEGGNDALNKASEGVEHIASSVGSVIGDATEAVIGRKDEL